MITLLMKALLWHFVTEYLVYGKTNETLNLKNVLSFILNPEISIFNWKLEKKKKKVGERALRILSGKFKTWIHTFTLGIVSSRSRNSTLLPTVFHLYL